MTTIGSWRSALSSGRLLSLALCLVACSSMRANRPGVEERDHGSGRREKAASERDEAWYEIRIQDRAVGWSMERDTQLEDGGHEVLSRLRMRLKRADAVVELGLRVLVRENADGSVRDFETEQVQSRETQRVHGRVDGQTLRLEIASPGTDETISRDLPHEPRALGVHAVWKRCRDALRKEGDRVELHAFLADQLRSAKQTFTAGPEESVKIGGRTRTLRRIDTSIEPGLRLTMWVDEQHEAQRVSMPALGMQIEFVRSTRDAVLAADLGSPPEVFFASAVPLRGALPRSPVQARFRVRARDAGHDLVLAPVDAAGQELERDPDGAWTISTRSIRGPEGVRIVDGVDSKLREELAPYLRATAIVQSENPRIVAAARKAIGAETDSTRAARALESFVERTVKTKDLGTAFASALEVLDRREGDCTEHAVLLAALARAVGIPSRGVVGLVRHRDSMVGHMWTELHTGSWVPYDATLGRGAVPADRIALATSPLDSETSASLFLGLLPVLGQVSVEVLSSR